jgi:hypothetical protein
LQANLDFTPLSPLNLINVLPATGYPHQVDRDEYNERRSAAHHRQGVLIMIKRQRRYPIDEIARRGTELYETKIRPLVQPDNDGRILAIDIESGEYAVADESLEACQVLIDKNPDAQIWSLRIGYVAVGGFGGAVSREKR